MTLKPLLAGGIQAYSLQSFIQSQSQSLQMFVTDELRRQIESIVDRAFIRDDGTGGKPTGLYALTEAGNQVSISANGGPVTLAKLKETEQKLAEADVSMENVRWLINEKLRIAAEQILQFPVNGSKTVYSDGMLAGVPALTTNHIDGSLNQGTGRNTTTAVLFNPDAFLVGRWKNGLMVSVNTLGEPFFKKAQVGIRVLDYCNLVARRKDIGTLKGITT